MTTTPLLVIHISAGITSLLSGAVAMTFRKGSRGHVVAGKVFVFAMLSMAGAGVFMAVMKSQTGNVLGGVMTLTWCQRHGLRSGAEKGKRAFSSGLRSYWYWRPERSW